MILDHQGYLGTSIVYFKGKRKIYIDVQATLIDMLIISMACEPVRSQ